MSSSYISISVFMWLYFATLFNLVVSSKLNVYMIYTHRLHLIRFFSRILTSVAVIEPFERQFSAVPKTFNQYESLRNTDNTVKVFIGANITCHILTFHSYVQNYFSSNCWKCSWISAVSQLNSKLFFLFKSIEFSST